MLIFFIYIPFYVLQVIKMTADSIPEIPRCCFSNQAIKTVGEASSYSNFLSNTDFVTILCEKENTY